MRVAIIGQQAFAKSVLESFLERGDEVVGVFCAPEKEGARPDPLRVAAEEHGFPVFQLASLRGEEAENAMRSLDADLAVMAYVLQFAPDNLTSIPKHGTIDYHPSLLPKYRGPSSINWAVIKGESETGLSIFRPTKGLDEGPIILQKTIPIAPDDTTGSLYFDYLFPLGIEAILEAADLVVAGRHVEVTQDDSKASYEGWCRDKEALINWHSHIDTIHNLVRGCDPMPGAWTVLNGEKLRLYGARKHPTRRLSEVEGKPGEVLLIDDDRMHIAAQGGVLEIAKVLSEQGEKKKMSAGDFAKSIGLSAGARLGETENP